MNEKVKNLQYFHPTEVAHSTLFRGVLASHWGKKALMLPVLQGSTSSVTRKFQCVLSIFSSETTVHKVNS